MGVQVSGSNVSVTIANADSLNWTSNLVFSVDNTYDIGAAGATRPRTGYFGTSVVSPSLTNAGTLALSATGANAITASTNGVERLRIYSGGEIDAHHGVRITGVNAPTAGEGLELQYFSNQGKLLSYDRTGAAYKPLLLDGSYIDLATAGTGRLRVAVTTGNVLVGTTTDDGSSKLQVGSSTNTTQKIIAGSGNYAGTITLQSGGSGGSGDHAYVGFVKGSTGQWILASPWNGGTDLEFIDASDFTGRLKLSQAGTMTLYNAKATTGVTSAVIRAGAGQGTTMLQSWQNNAGSSLTSITPGGAYLSYGSSTSTSFSNSGVLLEGGASAPHARLSFLGDGSGYQLSIGGRNGTTYTSYMLLDDSGPSVKFGTTIKIGFFGATPVVKQTATADAASLLALLQAYGLAV